jgi:hypothetical protein
MQAAVTLFRTLEDLLSHHLCTIIVGPPSCGKTALWQLLLKALQKAYTAAKKEVSLVPDDVLTALHVWSQHTLYDSHPESYLAAFKASHAANLAGAYQFTLRQGVVWEFRWTQLFEPWVCRTLGHAAASRT